MAFGIGQITKRTPTWVKAFIAIAAIVTGALAFWVGSTNLIQDNIKVELLNGIKVIDMIILGIAPLFGVQEKTEKQDA
jgi:hypothetical protein